MTPRYLTRRDKFEAIFEATTPDLDDVVPRPRRRFRAACTGPGTWRICDTFDGSFLSEEQLDALTVPEILQEYGSAS